MKVVLFLAALAALTYLSVHYVLGRLPGDIVIDRGSYYFYLPITTCIIVSVLLSFIFWFFGRG
jgi:hypothetical protein